jgi:hypothetical protein
MSQEEKLPSCLAKTGRCITVHITQMASTVRCVLTSSWYPNNIVCLLSDYSPTAHCLVFQGDISDKFVVTVEFQFESRQTL